MPPFRPDALIFDMDGLMVDSEPVWLEAEKDFMRRRGAPWSTALAQACVGRGLPQTVATMVEAAGGVGDPEADLAELIALFLARAGEVALKPGLLELLERADVPRAVGSSSPRALVETVLERHALLDRFAAVIAGDDVPKVKPAPDIFLAAARAVSVPPERCLVLEDSLAGVEAARAAGMLVIAIPEREHDLGEMHALASAVVSSLFEASALLDLPGAPGEG